MASPSDLQIWQNNVNGVNESGKVVTGQLWQGETVVKLYGGDGCAPDISEITISISSR